MTLRKLATMAGAVGMFVVPALGLSADIDYDFNNVVTGATPGGPAPWANLIGNQNGANVDFTLTFYNFAGPEAATEFLNLMEIQYTGGLAGTSITESSASIVGYDIGSKTDASIHFDGDIDFPNPNNANRLTPGESVNFTLNNVDADKFTMFMIHINGIGGDSSKVNNSVPEPASMAALGLGALGLLRRRRNKK